MKDEYETAGIGSVTGRGHNIGVWSGKAFWPLDPRVEEIDLLDIARSLSMLCRFNGHVKAFYSVAQHSVLVSRNVAEGFEIEGLLHDAAEAYVGDMVRPLKAHMPDYRAVEEANDAVVRARFGLPAQCSPEVKEADRLAVVTERRDVLLHPQEADWGELPEPWPHHIVPWSPALAEVQFLRRAQILGLKVDWTEYERRKMRGLATTAAMTHEAEKPQASRCTETVDLEEAIAARKGGV